MPRGFQRQGGRAPTCLLRAVTREASKGEFSHLFLINRVWRDLSPESAAHTVALSIPSPPIGVWAGGEGNEGQHREGARFPQGGDSLSVRRWEGSQKGIKVHAGEVPVSSPSFYWRSPALTQLKPHRLTEVEQSSEGSGGCRGWGEELGPGNSPQARRSAPEAPIPSVHWSP